MVANVRRAFLLAVATVQGVRNDVVEGPSKVRVASSRALTVVPDACVPQVHGRLLLLARAAKAVILISYFD